MHGYFIVTDFIQKYKKKVQGTGNFLILRDAVTFLHWSACALSLRLI